MQVELGFPELDTTLRCQTDRHWDPVDCV